MSSYNPNATAERRTRSNYPSTGNDDVLNCGLFSGRTERGYLLFPDLSATIDGATVNSAYLRLKQISGGYATQLDFSITLLQGSSLSGITYDTVPSAVGGVVAEAGSLYGTSAGYRYFDVTDLVQDIADSTVTDQIWEIKRTSSGTYDGKNFSTSYGDHQLIIDYTIGAPPSVDTVTFEGVPVGASCVVTDNNGTDTAVANRTTSSDVVVDVTDLTDPFDRVAIWSEADGGGTELFYLDTDDYADLGPDDVYTLTGTGVDTLRIKAATDAASAQMDLSTDGLVVSGDTDSDNFESGATEGWNGAFAVAASGSMTALNENITESAYSIVGPWVEFFIRFTVDLGGTASNIVYLALPIAAESVAALQYTMGMASGDGNSAYWVGDGATATTIAIVKWGAANYALGTGKVFYVSGKYRWK